MVFMTTLPPSSRYLQNADQPVEDDEREGLAKTLSDAFSEGRLEQDAYLEGLDVVYAARHLGDLVPVVEKLPAPSADVPAIIEEGTVPAGEVNQPGKTMAYPMLMAGIGGVALLLILAIFVAVMILT